MQHYSPIVSILALKATTHFSSSLRSEWPVLERKQKLADIVDDEEALSPTPPPPAFGSVDSECLNDVIASNDSLRQLVVTRQQTVEALQSNVFHFYHLWMGNTCSMMSDVSRDDDFSRLVPHGSMEVYTFEAGCEEPVLDREASYKDEASFK